MRKYNAEQLSRILGEHEAENLFNGGGAEDNERLVCVEQAARNIDYNERADANRAAIFDRGYRLRWTPDELLDALIGWGMA